MVVKEIQRERDKVEMLQNQISQWLVQLVIKHKKIQYLG